MKIGIIIQARTQSTRLPNKIFLEAGGKSLLQIQVDRLRYANYPIYIATSNNPHDESILKFALNNQIGSYAGSENNVLERFYFCAKQYKLDVIIRITADCPLIDPNMLKYAGDLYLFRKNKNLFLSNTLERTYPRGLDFEIFSFPLLESAYFNSNEDGEKEHVTPYIWRNRGGNVEIEQIKLSNYNYSNFRITVDTIEDYTLINNLINKYNADKLNADQIIQILLSNPELAAINLSIKQKDI